MAVAIPPDIKPDERALVFTRVFNAPRELVFKAWTDPECKDPRTLHHRGWGAFMVAGDTIRLPSKMK